MGGNSSKPVASASLDNGLLYTARDSITHDAINHSDENETLNAVVEDDLSFRTPSVVLNETTTVENSDHRDNDEHQEIRGGSTLKRDNADSRHTRSSTEPQGIAERLIHRRNNKAFKFENVLVPELEMLRDRWFSPLGAWQLFSGLVAEAQDASWSRSKFREMVKHLSEPEQEEERRKLLEAWKTNVVLKSQGSQLIKDQGRTLWNQGFDNDFLEKYCVELEKQFPKLDSDPIPAWLSMSKDLSVSFDSTEEWLYRWAPIVLEIWHGRAGSETDQDVPPPPRGQDSNEQDYRRILDFARASIHLQAQCFIYDKETLESLMESGYSPNEAWQIYIASLYQTKAEPDNAGEDVNTNIPAHTYLYNPDRMHILLNEISADILANFLGDQGEDCQQAVMQVAMEMLEDGFGQDFIRAIIMHMRGKDFEPRRWAGNLRHVHLNMQPEDWLFEWAPEMVDMVGNERSAGTPATAELNPSNTRHSDLKVPDCPEYDGYEDEDDEDDSDYDENEDHDVDDDDDDDSDQDDVNDWHEGHLENQDRDQDRPEDDDGEESRSDRADPNNRRTQYDPLSVSSGHYFSDESDSDEQLTALTDEHLFGVDSNESLEDDEPPLEQDMQPVLDAQLMAELSDDLIDGGDLTPWSPPGAPGTLTASRTRPRTPRYMPTGRTRRFSLLPPDPSSASPGSLSSSNDSSYHRSSTPSTPSTPSPSFPRLPLGPQTGFHNFFTRNRPSPRPFRDYKVQKVPKFRYENRLHAPRRLPNTPTNSHQPLSPTWRRKKDAAEKRKKGKRCEACGRRFIKRKDANSSTPSRGIRAAVRVVAPRMAATPVTPSPDVRSALPAGVTLRRSGREVRRPARYS